MKDDAPPCSVQAEAIAREVARHKAGYWVARYDSRGVDCGDTWVRVCLTRPPRERIVTREEPRSVEEVAAARADFAAYLKNYDANLAAYWAEVEAGRQ